MTILNNQQKWNSKYYEKIPTELSLFSYQDLELKKYIKQFFKLNCIFLHKINLQYSEATLQMVISYYNSTKSVVLIKNLNFQYKLTKQIKLNYKNNKFTKNRLKFIKYYKKIQNLNKFNNKQNLEFNSFSQKLIESISLFTKKKTNITLIFQNLNKGLSLNLTKLEIQALKQLLTRIRRTFNNNFVEEMVNVLLISIRKKKSAEFLTQFVSHHLNESKPNQQKFFLNFLKQILFEISNTILFKINGIKISIKGRLNGIQRTKISTISVGKISLQAFHNKIDYYQSVAYTSTGILGIKIWIAENNNYVFTT